MALSQQVKDAFSGNPIKTKILKGTIIARFFSSNNKEEAYSKPFGRWWIHIPSRQISNPQTYIDDIRSHCNGLKEGGRELLAIKEEWSDMKYWTQITVTEEIDCYIGKAAGQGDLSGGWEQIYIENPDLEGKYSRQNVQCVEL